MNALRKKFRLYRDDVLQDTPDVEEALRRLPAHLKEDRDFRVIRAMQLNCANKILPKEQWTKLEEDVPYLQPYIEEVRRERIEREIYDAE
ncbi:cytochrome b-c1 complex subunit 7 isoform X2 [Megachile rotundata]|uniref:cytochrome b-c1 complex subunit 7 isoform X2 n=1 Tax=Megachile rotundata TaxID=143995 RepID=UPI0006153547|nr:PREDICTED: cytochrome b-c1 complex subunit 7-like isoform X2 [Megachile rotundata]